MLDIIGPAGPLMHPDQIFFIGADTVVVDVISIEGYIPFNSRKTDVLTSSLTLASFNLTLRIYVYIVLK